MVILLIIAGILIILGIIGSILPGIPGPFLSFLGLIFLAIAKGTGEVSILSLLIFGILMAILIMIDFVSPYLGARIFGASKQGTRGSVAGGIFGLVVSSPFWAFFGSLAGTFLGEIHSGKNLVQALRTGIKTFIFGIFVIIFQFIYSLIAAIYFFIKIF